MFDPPKGKFARSLSFYHPSKNLSIPDKKKRRRRRKEISIAKRIYHTYDTMDQII